jgi:hypothetical protein
MSRVSLGRRLQGVLEQAERINPQAARVHRMAPAVRAQFDRWRAVCDSAHAPFAGDEPGAAYAALLAGEFVTPEPPRAVADALQLPATPVLHESLTTDDLARMWADMIDG